MSTYGDAPTRSWNLPLVRPLAVLLTTVAVVGAGWLAFAPGPDGRLVPADVDGDWPFVDQEVEVFCRNGSPVVEVDDVRYALTAALRGRPDLQTFDLDVSDDVWVRRPNGTKATLGPVTEAAARICADQ